MTDSDIQSGPSVTLDPNGNVILPYNAIKALSDVTYAVTPVSGADIFIPKSQFTNGDPGVQTTPGTVVVNDSYMRSLGII